jgi:hypothetical protein
LPEIFDKLGVNFNDRILPSVVNEVLKAVVAKYNAEVGQPTSTCFTTMASSTYFRQKRNRRTKPAREPAMDLPMLPT